MGPWESVPRATRPPTSAMRSRTSAHSGATRSRVGGEYQEVLCAISEVRGISPTVGLALVNMSTSEVILSQICDNQFYNNTVLKLTIHQPSIILMVSTACPPSEPSALWKHVNYHFPGTSIQPLGRRYWSEKSGMEYIDGLCASDELDSVKVAIQGTFYATSSFAAVSSDTAYL